MISIVSRHNRKSNPSEQSWKEMMSRLKHGLDEVASAAMSVRGRSFGDFSPTGQVPDRTIHSVYGVDVDLVERSMVAWRAEDV
jgi:hypothetical protein